MTEYQVFTFIVDIAAGAVIGTNVIIFLRLRRLHHQMLEAKKALDETRKLMEIAMREAVRRDCSKNLVSEDDIRKGVYH